MIRGRDSGQEESGQGSRVLQAARPRSHAGSTVLKVMGGADDINRHMMMGTFQATRSTTPSNLGRSAPGAMETRRLVFSGERGAPAEEVFDGQH